MELSKNAEMAHHHVSGYHAPRAGDHQGIAAEFFFFRKGSGEIEMGLLLYLLPKNPGNFYRADVVVHPVVVAGFQHSTFSREGSLSRLSGSR